MCLSMVSGVVPTLQHPRVDYINSIYHARAHACSWLRLSTTTQSWNVTICKIVVVIYYLRQSYITNNYVNLRMEYVEHGVFLWVPEATKGQTHLFLTICESLYFRKLLSLTIDHLYQDNMSTISKTNKICAQLNSALKLYRGMPHPVVWTLTLLYLPVSQKR